MSTLVAAAAAHLKMEVFGINGVLIGIASGHCTHHLSLYITHSTHELATSTHKQVPQHNV